MKNVVQVSSGRTEYYGWLNLEDLIVYRDQNCFTVKDVTPKALAKMEINSYYGMKMTDEMRKAIATAHENY